MLRNWVWNFNPNPVGETDEVNEALIGGCAKEKWKKKWMEEVKSENCNETASGNEVEWQGIGRWLAAAWRSVNRLVPSLAQRNCTSSSFQIPRSAQFSAQYSPLVFSYRAKTSRRKA